MSRLPSVSIIIPTLNRKKYLREALLSLTNVDYPRELLEVVVVSDGSTDGTEKMIKKIKGKLNYSLKFFEEKRMGISHAKNVAIKNSQGEIIVSTDDDCLFEKGWLKKLLRPFLDKKKRSVGSVGGPDRAIPSDSFLAKCIDFTFSSFIGAGGIHGRFTSIQLGKFYPVGCNMAFPRKVFEQVGEFIAYLAPGEDTDLNHRIEKAGYELVYVPEAFVWHRGKTSLPGFIKNIFKRGQARVEIIRKHREYQEFIYFLPAAALLTFLTLLVLSIFSKLFFYILIFLCLIYFILLSIGGLSAAYTYKNPLYIFFVPPLIAIQHCSHGLGFIYQTGRLSFRRIKESFCK